MATNELMSDERLARLAARIENIRHVQQVGPRNLSDLEHWQLQAIALAYADDVDELLDVIREQQAQIAAMRPIVEAMAQPNHQDSACYVLCNREVVALSGSGVFVTPHSKPCLIEQARAFVAAHPATDTDTDTPESEAK